MISWINPRSTRFTRSTRVDSWNHTSQLVDFSDLEKSHSFTGGISNKNICNLRNHAKKHGQILKFDVGKQDWDYFRLLITNQWLVIRYVKAVSPAPDFQTSYDHQLNCCCTGHSPLSQCSGDGLGRGEMLQQSADPESGEGRGGSGAYCLCRVNRDITTTSDDGVSWWLT